MDKRNIGAFLIGAVFLLGTLLFGNLSLENYMKGDWIGGTFQLVFTLILTIGFEVTISRLIKK